MVAMVNRTSRHVLLGANQASWRQRSVAVACLATLATLVSIGPAVPSLKAAGASVKAGAANAPTALTAIEVADLDGRRVTPLKDDGRKATVLFFLMHECPVANAYAPEISRLQAEYGERGVRSYVVYIEDDLPVAKAREHAQEYGFKAGSLLDPGHLLVKATGATVSPEAAVLSPDGKLLYLGRIDDRVAGFGKRRVEPTRRDLRLALDAVLAGKKVETRRTKAVGCYIPEPAAADSKR